MTCLFSPKILPLEKKKVALLIKYRRTFFGNLKYISTEKILTYTFRNVFVGWMKYEWVTTYMWTPHGQSSLPVISLLYPRSLECCLMLDYLNRWFDPLLSIYVPRSRTAWSMCMQIKSWFSWVICFLGMSIFDR